MSAAVSMRGGITTAAMAQSPCLEMFATANMGGGRQGHSTGEPWMAACMLHCASPSVDVCRGLQVSLDDVLDGYFGRETEAAEPAATEEPVAAKEE